MKIICEHYKGTCGRFCAYHFLGMPFCMKKTRGLEYLTTWIFYPTMQLRSCTWGRFHQSHALLQARKELNYSGRGGRCRKCLPWWCASAEVVWFWHWQLLSKSLGCLIWQPPSSGCSGLSSGQWPQGQFLESENRGRGSGSLTLFCAMDLNVFLKACLRVHFFIFLENNVSPS